MDWINLIAKNSVSDLKRRLTAGYFGPYDGVKRLLRKRLGLASEVEPRQRAGDGSGSGFPVPNSTRMFEFLALSWRRTSCPSASSFRLLVELPSTRTISPFWRAQRRRQEGAKSKASPTRMLRRTCSTYMVQLTTIKDVAGASMSQFLRDHVGALHQVRA